MKRTFWMFGAVALVAGCGGDGGTDPGDMEPEDNVEAFAVQPLTPSSIVGPVVTSGATGTATFAYDETDLTYQITVQSMDAVIQAHIHGPAGTTDNASVILTLFNPDNPTGLVNGTLVSGTVQAGSGLLSAGITLARVLELMRSDSAFVMVHSTTYPDGEIRGQVIPPSP